MWSPVVYHLSPALPFSFQHFALLSFIPSPSQRSYAFSYNRLLVRRYCFFTLGRKFGIAGKTKVDEIHRELAPSFSAASTRRLSNSGKRRATSDARSESKKETREKSDREK
ncbi:hypothetical protein MTO96_000884 [Rhipicephalus appendiculatus]